MGYGLVPVSPTLISKCVVISRLPTQADVYTDYHSAQYLAVSTTSSIDSPALLGTHGSPDSKASIQIWSISSPSDGSATVQNAKQGEMRCELVLCIKGGAALEVKWTPLGAWDSVRVIDVMIYLSMLIMTVGS
jgi:hypothetical protein